MLSFHEQALGSKMQPFIESRVVLALHCQFGESGSC